MSNIYDREDELWSLYSDDEQDLILKDGLCLSDIMKAKDINDQSVLESYWTNSSKRILFMLKEGPDQEGEDYRDYLWGSKKCGCKIKTKLREIIWRLNNLELNPSKISEGEEVFEKYPFAIVNLKKPCRNKAREGSESDWEELRFYANRDKDILKRQIREILKPNIIVCCGYHSTKGSIIDIASQIIYEDIIFKEFKIGNVLWCKYNLEKEIFLLNSYHLSHKDCNPYELVNAFKTFIINHFQNKYFKK